ncbi:hypothetical protein [Flavobacterium sp. N2820]|uniref:hypothetical protein n=1 Tax=Flavobacterium sp. N2820 TaxID=2986834 RepID=UPI00222513BB|nr:hypothetical protein [Flavobacterium sp. N2820]
MKKLNRTTIKYQLVVIVLFLAQFVQAQPGFDDGDDVVDVPAAPIDEWIFPMVFLGIAMMVYYTKKKQCTES